MATKDQVDSLPDDLEEDFEVIEDEQHTEEEKELDETCPEWTEYMLSLLTEDELKDGKPSTEGLVRICRERYPDFFVAHPTVHTVGADYAAVTCPVYVNVQYWH